MDRATCALVVALAAAGCASSAPEPAAAPSRVEDTCRDEAERPWEFAPLGEPPWGAMIARVEVRGLEHVPSLLARSVLRSRAGAPLDEATLASDLERLEALEVFRSIAVESDTVGNGVVLAFVVEERRRVETVTLEGLQAAPRGRWVPVAPGELFDPARLHRSARDLEAHLQDSGYRQARVEPRSHERADGRQSVCYRVKRGPRYLIGALDFVGNRDIASAELRALVDTHDETVNAAGKPLREDLLEPDLLRVTALYYERGYLGVRLDPLRLRLDPKRERVDAEIPIEEGPQYRLGKLEIVGAVTGSARAELARLGLESGELFVRSKVSAAIARLEERYRSRGRPVRVSPETALHPERARVDVAFRLEREP